MGPDPGIRINYRVGRFVKSYLRWFNWNDDLYYVQGQAYWILANWMLYDRTGDNKFRDIAIKCTDYVLERQLDNGAWEYPNPEWKGRIATVEGMWGSLGLLASFRQMQNNDYLNGVLRWHAFLENEVRYQKVGDELAINYFANSGGVRVPNNSTTLLRVLAELAEATGDRAYLEPCRGWSLLSRMYSCQRGNFPMPSRAKNLATAVIIFNASNTTPFNVWGLWSTTS